MKDALVAIDLAWFIYQGPELADRIDLDQERAKTLMTRGTALWFLGRLEDALAASDQAWSFYQGPTLVGRVDLDSDRAGAQMNRGTVLSDLGRLEDALAAFRTAWNLYQGPTLEGRVDLNPNRAMTQMNRGNAFCRLGRQKDALAAYDQALSHYQLPTLADRVDLDPSRAMTQTNRGNALSDLGNLEDAMTAYKQAWRFYEGNTLKSRADLDTYRFQLLFNMCDIFSNMIETHRWASESSRFMVSTLEMAPHPNVSDLYACRHEKLRIYFAMFHTRWLRFCLETGAYEQIPTILLALQGRKLAGMILDELDQGEHDPNTPEAVRRLKQLRQDIRKLDVNIMRIVGGRHHSRSEGTRVMSFSDIPLSANQQQLLDEWTAARSEAFDRYLKVRSEVSNLDNYRLIQPHLERIKGDALSQSLLVGQAIVILLDFHTGQDTQQDVQGILLLRPGQDPVWLALAGLHQLSSQLALYNRSLAGRGLRRNKEDKAPEPDAFVKMSSEQLARFWPDLRQSLQEQFWQPLAPHLAGVKELMVIGHGRLHILPVECGAPEKLVIRHYPGLIFYAQHRGLLDRESTEERSSSLQSRSVNRLGALCHEGNDDEKLIPMTTAEKNLLRGLWKSRNLNVSVEGDSGATYQTILSRGQNGKKGTDVLHIACHGSGTDPDHPEWSMLEAGHGLNINMSLLMSQGPQPEQVILSACLAAQTAEDLDGDPLGLVSGWFLKGTRQLVGAISPLPDLWMPIFSGLLHQALLNDPEHSLQTALVEAKRRMALGDWVNDPELAEPIRQSMGERLNTLYWSKARLHEMEQDWQTFWTSHLSPELSMYGFDSERLARVESDLLATPKPSAIDIGRLCSQATLDHLFAHPVPPDLILDTLRYAIRCYG
jgi:hypothetical protein